MKSTFRHLLTLLLCTVLWGCSSKAPQQTSVILILVEGLSFSAVTCNDSDSQDGSGFQIFCDESVRFTHAFTPSVLSQSTVASVLTGRYPPEHGVWHNGNQFLPARIVTFAEAAYQNKYQTAFFSGGAPILRKAAINQGFEIFEDNITPSLTKLYRPAAEVIDHFLEWKIEDVGNQRSLGVLFIGDLQFTDFATTDELGMVRESSYQSQLHEVDTQLFRLIRELKNEKMWAESTVILAGLNGYPAQGRTAEIKPLNLFSEGTRVTLMIKPPRKEYDEPSNWTYDSNVSLVDVGATVFDLIDRFVPSENAPYKVQSLNSIFKGPNTKSFDERKWILSSSAWCGQQGIGCGTRIGLREGPLFFLYDQNRKLYNTLLDNFETSPLPGADIRFSKTVEYENFAREKGLQAWVGVAKNLVAKVQLGRLLWNVRGPTKDSINQLKRLSDKYKNDAQLSGWRALLALRRNDWDELKAAARETNEDWIYVADANLNEKSKSKPSSCLKHAMNLLQRRKSSAPRECDDQELLRLYDLIAENGDDQDRQRSFDNFSKIYLERMIDLRVAEQNLVADADWDVSLDQPSQPTIVDLVLSLPDARRFRIQLRERLKI